MVLLFECEALSVTWDWNQSAASNCKQAWLSGAHKSRALRLAGTDPYLQYSGFDRAGAMKSNDILFIHVGKTGGSSVSWGMRSNKLKINEIHVHPVLPGMLHRHKYVFITIRDPADRFVDAFKHNHPLGSHPNGHRVYTCFDSAASAAAGVFDETPCGHLGRSGSEEVDLHTEMVFWYRT